MQTTKVTAWARPAEGTEGVEGTGEGEIVGDLGVGGVKVGPGEWGGERGLDGGWGPCVVKKKSKSLDGSEVATSVAAAPVVDAKRLKAGEKRLERAKEALKVAEEAFRAWRRGEGEMPKKNAVENACRRIERAEANLADIRAGKPKAPPKPKPKRIGGETVTQIKRRYGDLLKPNMRIEKWAVPASTLVETTMEMEVFHELIVANASTITPPEFDASTPVVVAELVYGGAVEAFGKSKISASNRCSSSSLSSMDCIYFPATKSLRIRWNMSGVW